MNAKQWNEVLRHLQFAGYAIIFASLPLSNFFMSFGMFWIVGVWLLRLFTNLYQKKKPVVETGAFFKQKPVWLITLLFLIPLAGLLWTDDYAHAFWDLRMKLPLLVMPFLLATLPPLKTAEYRKILGIFLLALTVAAIWCLLIYFHVIPKHYDDVREISVFISHIRFSLLLVTGIFILYYEAWPKPYGKALTILLSIVFLLFLFIIGSVTGFAILFITAAISLLSKSYQTGFTKKNIVAIGSLMILIITGALYTAKAWKGYFNVQPLHAEQLERATRYGEPYEHNPEYPMVEEGHYVMTHIAWGELYKAWGERSSIHPDSLDARGHQLKGTLIRYLASKGLYKDADGIAALSETDIQAIESGITSIHENDKHGLDKRLDKIMFEYANYRAGGTPNGHSVFQRLEFWRAAWFIIRGQPLTGVGTGDVKTAFADAYDKIDTKLDKQYRLRAHNQYLTMWLTYGIFGLVAFLFVLFAGWKFPGKKRPLLRIFIVISALSFLSEDTLESQAGVMFFVMFMLLFTLKREVTHSELRPV